MPTKFSSSVNTNGKQAAMVVMTPTTSVTTQRGQSGVIACSASVANCYGGAVRPGGNPRARAVLEQAFVPTDAVWRGLGRIPGSGLTLRPELRPLDAAERFPLTLANSSDPPGCRCGDVLRGAIDPPDCPLFGRACTPEDPVGACMVSSEGSCAASFTHGDGARR